MASKSDKIFLWLLTPFLLVWVCLLVFIDTFVNPMWNDNKGVPAPPSGYR